MCKNIGNQEEDLVPEWFEQGAGLVTPALEDQQKTCVLRWSCVKHLISKILASEDEEEICMTISLNLHITLL
jgi:hypothetical protein